MKISVCSTRVCCIFGKLRILTNVAGDKHTIGTLCILKYLNIVVCSVVEYSESREVIATRAKKAK